MRNTPSYPKLIRNGLTFGGGASPQLLQLNSTSSTGLTHAQSAFNSLSLSDSNATQAKITKCLITSTDTIDHELIIATNQGSTIIQLGTINIPALSGSTTSNPSVSILSSFPVLLFPSGHDLYIGINEAINSSKIINVYCEIEGY